jgi:outer membrane lipoprotein-sorting protein
MRKSIIYLVTVFLSISVSFAQMKKMEKTASFLKQMEQNTSSIQSIESDFKQVKHIDAFKQDITSSGKFYYKTSGKISLKYVKPMSYLIVINGDKLKIESDGKKNVMNLKDNKQLKEMQNILTACMTGNFSGMSNNYNMEFYEDEQFYLVSVKPVNGNIKKYIEKIDIYLTRKDMSVDKLHISETESDYTEYYFNNKKFNTLNSDALFKL